MARAASPQGDRPRVVIVGGGFGGLNAARALARAPVDVVLIDRTNHHLFQPLLYQVATAALSPADIASPIRQIVSRQQNVRTVLADVQRVDPDERVVVHDHGREHYDYLVLATGATYTYFGNDAWAGVAPGLKTVEDALILRRRFLLAFELAEQEQDPEARRSLLTFVVVGGGPTGVELAGAIIEVARHAIQCDFRRVDPTEARVILVEGNDRVLKAFPKEASARALKSLQGLGVDVRLDTYATRIDDQGVTVSPVDTDDTERIETEYVVWAAGVEGNPIPGAPGTSDDRPQRITVEPDLSVKDAPEVFVVGDLARATDPDDGEEVPGLAPAAIQMGRHVGKVISAEARARRDGAQTPERKPFHYVDKGMMAVIGRGSAVACVGGRTFGGFIAWFLWSVVHLLFLVGFRNRVLVGLEWLWQYATWQRGARLIVDQGRAVESRQSLASSEVTS